MSDAVIIRIVRPYSTVDEYLDAESSTISGRGMLLVGAEAVPDGTLVRFAVSLISGQVLIKAEGLVQTYLAPAKGRQGGLNVRFKRFGAATKQFIDRAVAHHSQGASPRSAPAVREVESSPPPSVAFTRSEVVLAELSTPDAGPPLEPITTEGGRGSGYTAREPSGVHHRPLGDVSPPSNRDELLDKLRERARRMSDAKIASYSKSAKVS